MTIPEIQKRIETEANFVNLKRFDYSLKLVLERYPDGAPARVIAHALMIAEDLVEDMYEQAVARLRVLMGVER